MKKSSLFILFMLFSLFLFAQQDNIPQYYFHINEAEINIVKGKLPKVKHHFEEAFKNKKNPFYQDIAVALEYGIEKKDENLIFMALRLLKRRSSATSGKLFIENTISKNYPSIKKLALSESSIASLDTIIGSRKINKKVEEQMKLLERLDQDERNRLTELGVYNKPGVQLTLRKQDSLNMISLLNLITENECNEMTSPSAGIATDMILTHVRAWKFYNWIPIMKKQVELGNYNNKRLADLLGGLDTNSTANSNDFGLNTYKVIFDKCIIYKVDAQKRKEISQNRASIYLDNFEDFQKKLLFGLKNDATKIYPVMSLLSSTKNANNEELEKVLTQQNEYLERENKSTIKKIVKIKPILYDSDFE